MSREAPVIAWDTPLQVFPRLEDIIFMPPTSPFTFDHLMISVIRTLNLVEEEARDCFIAYLRLNPYPSETRYAPAFLSIWVIQSRVKMIWHSRVQYLKGEQARCVEIFAIFHGKKIPPETESDAIIEDLASGDYFLPQPFVEPSYSFIPSLDRVGTANYLTHTALTQPVRAYHPDPSVYP
jgi:hypothetical protein